MNKILHRIVEDRFILHVDTFFLMGQNSSLDRVIHLANRMEKFEKLSGNLK